MSEADSYAGLVWQVSELVVTFHKQRERIGELEYLLAKFERREEEEDTLEKIPVPVAVVAIVTEGEYEPTVKGPFVTRGAAELWANRYEPKPGEVVHVLETEQP